MVAAGISTITQNLVGLRMPLYQGANGGWIATIIALSSTDYFKCPEFASFGNASFTEEAGRIAAEEEFFFERYQTVRNVKYPNF